MAATWDAGLLERVARATAVEASATGVHWTFSPVLCIARDLRWGRVDETFGEDPFLIGELGSAMIRGYQGDGLADPTAILATAKHFLADGGTQCGKDQGDAVISEEDLRRIHLPGYAAAVRAGVGSVMVSFSSWNGKKMHGNKYLLTDLLKGELGFRGLLVSDWAAIDQLSGDYERAIEAAERMAALRPGLPAYTRVAFLRSLLGDRAGALEMLRLAAAAGSRRDPESLAWTLVHLGHEHFGGGDLAAAARAYAAALDVVPDYYMALAGLGRVRAAEGRLDEAIHLYRRATARVPAPDLVGALGDVLAAAGQAEEAERQFALVEYMGRVAQAAGTTYGRQLALFYADHDRHLDEAVRLARQEAAGRGDIYTDDALGWALYKNGRLAEAKRAALRALRLGTEDALLHYHAGMIAAALEHPRQARRHLRRALDLNPHFDLRQTPLARAALAALEGPAHIRLAAGGRSR
jgi:tetratricopeptide (TPR) repeat protein